MKLDEDAKTAAQKLLVKYRPAVVEAALTNGAPIKSEA